MCLDVILLYVCVCVCGKEMKGGGLLVKERAVEICALLVTLFINFLSLSHYTYMCMYFGV